MCRNALATCKSHVPQPEIMQFNHTSCTNLECTSYGKCVLDVQPNNIHSRLWDKEDTITFLKVASEISYSNTKYSSLTCVM